MKLKKLNKILAVVLTGILVISMAACGATSQTPAAATTQSATAAATTTAATTVAATTATEKKEAVEVTSESTETSVTRAPNVLPETYDGPVITLTGYGSQNNLEKNKWVTDWIRDELHIELEFTDNSAGNKVFQAMLASGSLPDFMMIPDINMANDAAKAGLLLNLDDNSDKLPSIFEVNYLKNPAQFCRDNVSGDTGKLFLMPCNIGPVNGIAWDPDLRWDVYRQIGSPKIETLEDYVPVIQAMLEAYPVNDKGEKMVGLSTNAASDTFYMTLATRVCSWLGMAEYGNLPTVVEMVADGSTPPTSILAEDSVYKRALKFVYMLNQVGAFDLDAATQDLAAYNQKVKDGRSMMVISSLYEGSQFNIIANTSAENPMGYAPVWADEMKSIPLSANRPVGVKQYSAIGSSTKHPDEALALMNFVYDPSNAIAKIAGPKDVMWALDENNVPYVQEWAYYTDLKDVGRGGAATAFSSILPRVFSGDTFDAKYNEVHASDKWMSTLLHMNEGNKIWDDWKSVYGDYPHVRLWAEAKGRLSKTSSASFMMPPLPDDLALISSQVGDVIKTNSWRMVLAKNDAEFDTIWQEMLSKADGLGIKQVVDWVQNSFPKAKTDIEKYELVPLEY